MAAETTRRTFVTGSALASAGAWLASSAPTVAAPAESARPAQSPASVVAPSAAGALPKGKIGRLEVSRLVLGGSPLQHYVHCRDLRFVASLMARYNTPERVLQTLALAEQHGINTIVCHPSGPAGDTVDVLQQHRKRGGKLQWIIAPLDPLEPGLAKFGDMVRKLVDAGTEAVYLWGVQTDALAAQGKIDLVGKAVDLVKARSVPCGIAAHDLRVVQQCEKNRIPADFYIKTFHHHKYPSAALNYDSMWCSDPEETAAFMKGVEKPWIAFKVLAAGAIAPQEAFRHAFVHGADFVLAGMYDFEIPDDVRIAGESLAALSNRARPWRGQDAGNGRIGGGNHESATRRKA